MRILQVCNKIPYPPKDGGAIAILNLSLSFSRLGHDVKLLAMNTNKHYFKPSEIPKDITEKIDLNFIDINTDINYFRLIFNYLFSKKPYIAERFVNKTFEKKLVAILKKHDFDIIQLEGLYVTPYIDCIREHSRAKVAYRAHNIENEIWGRIGKASKSILKKIYANSLFRRLKKMEINLINNYDLLVPITSKDADFYSSQGNNRPLNITPAGISESSFKNPIKDKKATDIFFIGALDWHPNIEGLEWFIKQVWPALKLSLPNMAFHIAGRNAPNWLSAMCAESGIKFHGEVEDAKSFFDHHDIMIVPLFSGSGMRVKIIEAFARSKAVVTTSLGAEGIGAVNHKHMVIANDHDQFTNSIIDLINNQPNFMRLINESYEFAKTNFDSNVLANDLITFYKKNN